MIEKYITALTDIQNTKILNAYELKSWQGKAINIVSRIYGNDSKQEEQIKNVHFKSYSSGSINGTSFGGGNNAKECSIQASEIINGFISDLTNFGLPENKKPEITNGINISVNQNQNQSVQIHFIWESIKDELTGKQIRELEEVINEDLPAENKKGKVIEKLKSFGGDILTNIIANILTNPNIFG